MNTKVKLTEQELEDIWSALGYFIREYPNDGATETKRAMKRIIKKIRGKR